MIWTIRSISLGVIGLDQKSNNKLKLFSSQYEIN